MFGDKRARRVEELIVQHFGLVGELLRELQVLIKDYLADHREFKEKSYRVHSLEHEADQVRRKIERYMFEGAFMPVYREDYMDLVERVDKVANRGEGVADFIALTRPAVPEFLHQGMLAMIDLTIKAFDLLTQALGFLKEDTAKVRPVADQIEELEAEHFVLFLYVKKGAKIMLPRRNGIQYAKARNHVLIVIPVALISDIKLVKKGKGRLVGMMSYHVIEPFYRVRSIMPRLKVRSR